MRIVMPWPITVAEVFHKCPKSWMDNRFEPRVTTDFFPLRKRRDTIKFSFLSGSFYLYFPLHYYLKFIDGTGWSNYLKLLKVLIGFNRKNIWNASLMWKYSIRELCLLMKSFRCMLASAIDRILFPFPQEVTHICAWHCTKL